ncbi:MAG: WD40 repeat domain-containing protein [Planctomycetota bacterium]
MSDEAPPAAPSPEPWHRRVPARTMAIWLVLIVVVFLTRGRWEAWVVEELPPWPEQHDVVSGIAGERYSIRTEEYSRKTAQCLTVRDTERAAAIAEFWGEDVDGIFSPHRSRAAVFADGGVFRSEEDFRARKNSMGRLALVHCEARSVRPLGQIEGRVRTRSISWSPEGHRLVVADGGDVARVFEARTGAELHRLAGHTDRVDRAKWSPRGDRIVTITWRGDTRLWNARTGEEITALAGRNRPVLPDEPLFAADGGRIVSGRPSGDVHLLDAQTGDTVAVLGPAGRVLVSPDGGFVAAVTEVGETAVETRIWDAETGAEVFALAGRAFNYHPRPEFSPDGRRLLVCGLDWKFRVYDVEKSECLFVLAREARFGLQLDTASFFPNGSRIVGADEADGYCIWDGADGTLLAVLHDEAIDAMPLTDRDVLVMPNGQPYLWRRTRPEWWWGIAWLPHFWLIAALALALAWSARRDMLQLRKSREDKSGA